MAICFAMIEDFQSGGKLGRMDENGKPRYGIADLENGIEYAQSGLECGRRQQIHPPTWDFDTFIPWARQRIDELSASTG